VALCESKYYVLRLDRHCRLLIAQRKPVHFDDLDDIRRCFEQIERELIQLQRSAYKLLVDVRQGPCRNDGAFEAEIARYRGKLLFGFARNAALRRTMAGQLQIQRYAQTDSREVFVTTTPEEAFDYLEVPRHRL
jgi:hypothetical protein